MSDERPSPTFMERVRAFVKTLNRAVERYRKLTPSAHGEQGRKYSPRLRRRKRPTKTQSPRAAERRRARNRAERRARRRQRLLQTRRSRSQRQNPKR